MEHPVTLRCHPASKTMHTRGSSMTPPSSGIHSHSGASTRTDRRSGHREGSRAAPILVLSDSSDESSGDEHPDLDEQVGRTPPTRLFLHHVTSRQRPNTSRMLADLESRTGSNTNGNNAGYKHLVASGSISANTAQDTVVYLELRSYDRAATTTTITTSSPPMLSQRRSVQSVRTTELTTSWSYISSILRVLRDLSTGLVFIAVLFALCFLYGVVCLGWHLDGSGVNGSGDDVWLRLAIFLADVMKEVAHDKCALAGASGVVVGMLIMAPVFAV